MTVPLQELVRCLPRLPLLRLKRLLREMGKDGAETVSYGEALLLWLTHWMTATQPVPAEQQDLLVVELGKEIVAYGDSFDEKMRGPQAGVPAAVVSILDRAYAIVSGRDAFLVLARGDYVTGLTRPPLESISYNLASMYAAMRAGVARKPLQDLKSGPERANIK